MKNASASTSQSVFSTQLIGLAIALSVVTVVSIGAVNAQPSNLPPWAQRRSLPPDITSTTLAQSLSNAPARRAVRPDPTLCYIAADEPVVQAGFPPLPNQSDLTGSVGSWTAAESSVTNSWIIKEPHQGVYKHLPAGAFIPEDQKRHPRSSRSVIPASASFGKEPVLNPNLEQGVFADFPAPVILNQAKTQDLSLPDDEFNENNAQQKSSSSGNSMLRQLKRQVITQPLMQLNSSGSSLINRAIHF